MSLRDLFRCRTCAAKDTVLLQQVKTIDALIVALKDLEAGRRGVEVALATIAEARAGQAAERATLPPGARAVRTYRPAGPAKRAITPWLQSSIGGGHVNLAREQGLLEEQEAEENPAPAADDEPLPGSHGTSGVDRDEEPPR